MGGARHVSAAQSGEIYGSNRAVGDIQVRHQGRTGRGAFTEEVAFESCLEPKSGGVRKESRRTRHPGLRSLKCKGVETWLIVGSILSLV